MERDQGLRQIGGMDDLGYRQGFSADGTDNGKTIGITEYFDELSQFYSPPLFAEWFERASAELPGTCSNLLV